MFSGSKFIKADYEKPLENGKGDYSPIFFKKFNIDKLPTEKPFLVFAL